MTTRQASSWGSTLRSALTAAALGLMAVMAAHCGGMGAAGDRCNPNQLSDECKGGLSCQTNGCGISVCCPAVIDSNSPPECQATQTDCPPDGGAAGSGGAAGAAGGG